MSALIVMTGFIILAIIYFLGKGLLTVLEFVLELFGTLLSSGWFWIILGLLLLLLLVRTLVY